MNTRLAPAIFFALIHGLSAGPVLPSGDEIFTRMESEHGRRHDLLKRYTGSRQYTLHNARFGKQAAVGMPGTGSARRTIAFDCSGRRSSMAIPATFWRLRPGPRAGS